MAFASPEMSVVIPDISVPEPIRFAPDLLRQSADAVVTFLELTGIVSLSVMPGYRSGPDC
jgi:hypothetical protein